MKIGVVGAGKMGLPLAVQFACKGAEVIACDVRPEVVSRINQGDCPIDEPGVPEALAEMVRQGRLRASGDTVAAAGECDAMVVIVPALLTDDRHADLGILEAVTQQICEGAGEGLLVCYETTVPVGTTRRVFAEAFKRAGKVVDVAFSPERVKSMQVMAQLEHNPKIVGGVTAEAGERASAMYREYLGAPVVHVATAEAAEFVKLAGMLYRDVNIALANELARYAEFSNLDFPALIPHINTDGEAALLSPGIGVGGHCTPVYPYFLIHDARERDLQLQLAEQARVINDGQALHVVDRIEMMIGPVAGWQVLILGLGFRPQIKEHLFSPAFQIRDAFEQAGAEVFCADPLYTSGELQDHGLAPGTLQQASLPKVLVLNTLHDAFRSFDFGDLAARGVKVFVDGRNAFDPGEVEAAGIHYLGFGR